MTQNEIDALLGALHRIADALEAIYDRLDDVVGGSSDEAKYVRVMAFDRD